MTRALAPRPLANGKLYCAEFARTEDEQDTCMGDLEDAFFQSEADKKNGLTFFNSYLNILEKSRTKCGFWQRHFTKREVCK